MHYLGSNHPKEQVLKVLDLIGILMLRRHITGKPTGQNDDIFANLLRIKESERTPDRKRKQLLESYPTDEYFEKNFPIHDFKQIDRARYILTQIEYYSTGVTGEFIVSSPNDVHIEHIIPQKIDTMRYIEKFGDWISYLGDNAILIHKKKKNQIGNLTLLARDLNIGASNNPYKKKTEFYKTSNFEITKELANRDNFKFHDLDQRGRDLAKIAVKVWSF